MNAYKTVHKNLLHTCDVKKQDILCNNVPLEYAEVCFQTDDFAKVVS